MKYRIRQMMTNDVRKMGEVENEAFTHNGQWQACDYLTAFYDCRYNVAVSRPKSFGAVAYSAHCHTPSNTVIACIAVHPEFQKQGIGRKLLERIARVSPTGRLVAYLADDNFDGLAFFRRCGFTIIQNDKFPTGDRCYMVSNERSKVFLPKNRISGVANG